MPEQLPPTFTPWMTPSIILLGDSIFEFLSFVLYRGFVSKGLAKQKPYRLATGFAPNPKPIASLFTPTIPVIAPPKGSNALGLLCVSTLSAITYSSSNSIPPALSENTETHISSFPFSRRIFTVASLI